MIYILYPFLAVLSLIMSALAYILAPILPFFASIKDGPLYNGTEFGPGPRLPRWLGWFMTPDNSLDGDHGWQTEHWQWRFKFSPAIAAYIGQVGWLWRNPAYAFAITYIDGSTKPDYTGDKLIQDNDNARAGYLLVKAGKLFQFVWIKRIGSTNRCIYVNIGWNIRALLHNVNLTKNYRATFVFSPRISGFN